MTENLTYISDDELEHLIARVEQEELVAAPPDLEERILLAVEFETGTERFSEAKVAEVSLAVRKKEFRAYCFRVITSAAAAVALVFLLPELNEGMNLSGVKPSEHTDKNAVVQEVPSYEEVMVPIPSKNEVVDAKVIPSKEDVLNDTGFIEEVIINTTEWLSKDSKEQ